MFVQNAKIYFPFIAFLVTSTSIAPTQFAREKMNLFCKMYLSELQNYICPNCKIYISPSISLLANTSIEPQLFTTDSNPEMKKHLAKEQRGARWRRDRLDLKLFLAAIQYLLLVARLLRLWDPWVDSLGWFSPPPPFQPALILSVWASHRSPEFRAVLPFNSAFQREHYRAVLFREH